MNKKIIIGISAGAAAILLAIVVGLIVSINSNTNDAKEAAKTFVALLKEAELEKLSLEHYAYSEADNVVYKDENGVVRVQTLTRQQVAEIYGTEALLGVSEEPIEGEADTPTEEDVLKVIMEHTQMQANVSTAWGESANMRLQMLIPDIKTWMLNLTTEKLVELNSEYSDPLSDLSARMSSGEIESHLIQLDIPMIKQNGKWRFEVTEEIEHAFFGGMYNIFDKEAAE